MNSMGRMAEGLILAPIPEPRTEHRVPRDEDHEDRRHEVSTTDTPWLSFLPRMRRYPH